MAQKRRVRPLLAEVQRLRPELSEDAVEEALLDGRVLVDGLPVKNPAAQVAVGTSIVVREPTVLRGLTKMRGAFAAFDVASAAGGAGLDAGASAGGFVQAQLELGLARVYAVEVGFGQLLGSLRQDARVVNLERTNVGDLSRTLVPDPLRLVTLDLGYLSLAAGVPQLEVLEWEPGAHLVGLVKPVAELGLAGPPSDEPTIAEARVRARAGIESVGWEVVAEAPSPIPGSKGAIEWLVHARRRG